MKNLIAFADTETTELIRSIGTSLDLQPHIFEIYILLTTTKLKVVDEFYTLIKPPVPIPYFIEKMTGVTNQMVEKEKPFHKINHKRLKKLLESAKIFVAQNATFDKGMFLLEFERLGIDINFPENIYCTIEQSMHFEGYRLKSEELHEYATGKPKIKGVHRAKNDVLAMVEYYKFIKSGYLPKHLEGLRK